MKKLALIIAILFTPAAAMAEGTCNAQSVGVTQCMGNRECECKFFRKSEMAGTPDRFGWDCSLLRPNCFSDTSVNAPQQPYNGPASVGYGVSTSNTTLSNTPVTTQNQSPDTTINQQQQSPTTTNTSTSTQTQTGGTVNANQNSTQNQ